jgi:hypothetical protein
MERFEMFDKFIANLRGKIEGMLDESREDLFNFELNDKIFDVVTKKVLKKP